MMNAFITTSLPSPSLCRGARLGGSAPRPPCTSVCFCRSISVCGVTISGVPDAQKLFLTRFCVWLFGDEVVFPDIPHKESTGWRKAMDANGREPDPHLSGTGCARPEDIASTRIVNHFIRYLQGLLDHLPGSALRAERLVE